MNASRTRTTRATLLWAVVMVLALALPAADGFAQTPDDVCAAGELFLLSPPAIDLKLQTQGREGLLISWPDLDQVQATCFTLSGVDTLNPDITVDGGFGDDVDRTLRFTASVTGEVGGRDSRNLVVNWRNDGPGTYGDLAGALNLSNNGGAWYYDAAVDTMRQLNAGLPMTWRQVNIRALARGTGGIMLASFTRGASVDTDPRGLWRFDGTTWTRMAQDLFTDTVLVTSISFAPGDNDRFAVGTRAAGLFITQDGGQTFSQWTDDLDPAYATPPTTFLVSALDWSTSQNIYVGVTGFGAFYSHDGGASFARCDLMVPSSLDVASPTMQLPGVNSFTTDPGNPSRVLASLLYHGVYESLDAGLTWRNRYGDLLVSDPEATGAWVHSAVDAVIDRNDPQVIVMAVWPAIRPCQSAKHRPVSAPCSATLCEASRRYGRSRVQPCRGSLHERR